MQVQNPGICALVWVWASLRGEIRGGEADDLFVFQLPEAAEELADSEEILRGVEAEQAVNVAPQPGAGRRGRNRYGYDEGGWVALLKRLDRGVNACASGDSVIDQQDRSSGYGERWAVASVKESALIEHLPNLGCDALDIRGGDVGFVDDLLVEVAAVTGGDGAEG